MSFAVAAVVATTVVATSIYSSDQQRKAIHGQQDALKAQQEEDARKAAEAETSAQVAANAKIADANRRRRGGGTALALGDPTGTSDTLGGGGSALAAGGSPAARISQVFANRSSMYAGTVLGAGSAPAPAAGGARSAIPRSPSRTVAT